METVYGRDAIQFIVKGPIPINADDDSDLSGVSALDIVLARPSSIGELVFRNYYTATIALLVQYDRGGDDSKTESSRAGRGQGPWTCSVIQKVLMPNPHMETGSHDMFSISASESCVDWNNISTMRLILRQPSPLWHTYRIEEVNLYSDLPRLCSRPPEAGETDKLLSLIKRQTIAALNWSPQSSEPRTSASSPKLTSRFEQGSCGYEIHKLPHN